MPPPGPALALEAAAAWLAEERRGDPDLPAMEPPQIHRQLAHGVDRVMVEAGLIDPDFAAQALRQAGGDFVEATRLLAAHRTGLPGFGDARPLDTDTMACVRRISSLYRDVPGGELLGPTPDYTLRDLGADPAPPATGTINDGAAMPLPRLADLLAGEGLAAAAPQPVCPERVARLEMLARADEGYAVGLASALCHDPARPEAFLAELRCGHATVEIDLPELGFAVAIAEIPVAECETLGRAPGTAPFARGYGLVPGRGERKAIAMALIDLALQHPGATLPAGALLAQADPLRAAGTVEALKLPQHIAFAAELDCLRRALQDPAGGEASP